MTPESLLDAVDADAVTALIRKAVSAEILPRFRNLSKDQIRTKTGPQDLVTEADTEAERVLTRELMAFLPGSVVVGEEGTHADPTVQDRLSGPAPVWIIDPVDGTNNFSKGNETFACIVALAMGGETIAGWIDHCTTGQTVVAYRGRGCYQNGTPLRAADCSRPDLLKDCVGHIAGQPVGRILKPRLAHSRRVGSAAHAYLSLVRCQSDVAVFTRLKPWDHAAGILIHQEWGGVAKMVDGRPYRPTLKTGVPIMARTERQWQRVADAIGKAAELPRIG